MPDTPKAGKVLCLMKCPYCGFLESKVIDSRPNVENDNIRRRRECLSCGRRFTTYEVIESMPIVIIKQDKSRQPFDRNKILKGLMRAAAKRPVSLNQLEEIVDGIESQLQAGSEREIHSHVIGELVMESLKNVDEVAYVRFASVYKSYQDIDSFKEELNNLSKGKTDAVD